MSIPRVHLHLGTSPSPHQDGTDAWQLFYTSPYRDQSGEPALRASRMTSVALLRLSYSDGMQFWIDEQGSQVWAEWPTTSSLDDAATYLLGPVLGALLRIRGTPCLHASAVAFGNRAIAFAGPPGAGKSTTAALFAQRSYAILSDDIVALAEDGPSFQVLPACPFLCLWPESARMLYGSADHLPRFASSWEKRCLAAGNGNFAFEKHSLHLDAVYVLAARSSEGSGSAIEGLPIQSALVSLLANSYATKVLSPEMRAKEFEFWGRLASTTQIRSLRIPELPNTQAIEKLISEICPSAKDLR